MTITSRSGKVITLRPPQADDVEMMYDYISELGEEDVYILVNPDEPVTFKEEERYLQTMLERMRVGWEIQYLALEGNRMIGSCGISKPGRRKMHLGNFGISLRREYRHDTIGEQMARIVLAEAKEKLEITIVILEVFENNAAALAMYKKLGFTEYGRLPQGLKYKHGYNDAVYMYKEL